MVRKIIQIGNEDLLQRSEEVPVEKIKEKELQELIDDMIDTCNVDPASTGGLAAIQVDVDKRIILVNRIDLHDIESGIFEWEVMINPKIEIRGKKKQTFWEGCLSVGVGEDRLFGPVTRPAEITVTYYDRNAKRKRLEANGYFAQAIQHEYDHLEGILFLKYIPNPANIWKSKKLDEYLETHDDFHLK
jgi:peptide deformylase